MDRFTFLERKTQNYRVPSLTVTRLDETRVELRYMSAWRDSILTTFHHMTQESDSYFEGDVRYYLSLAEAVEREHAKESVSALLVHSQTPRDLLMQWGSVAEVEMLQSERSITPISYQLADMLRTKARQAKDKAYSFESLSSPESKAAKALGQAYTVWADSVWSLCLAFQPCPAVDFEGQVAFYESEAKRQAGRRTTCKPAKFARKILPFLSEVDCNAFAVWFKETQTPLELVTLQGKSRQAFRHAYQGDLSRSNDFDAYIVPLESKSLACSCMRYDSTYFGGLVHPAEAYASGDFKVLWTEDQKGKVASRVVVWTKGGRYVPAPIYTLSDTATQALYAVMTSEGYKPETRMNWEGATLAKIPFEGGRGRDDCFAMPYLDVERSISDTGDAFTVTRSGRLSTCTSGKVYSTGESAVCECCGEEMDEDDSYYDEDSSESLCESCYSDRFTSCACCGDTSRTDTLTQVRTAAWRTRDWCESCVQDSAVFCDSSAEWIQAESAVYVDCESVYIPEWDTSGYSLSSHSGEWFPLAEMVALPNGEEVHTSELDAFRDSYDFAQEESESGAVVWSITLKPWLELDESGQVLNRQLSLPLAA